MNKVKKLTALLLLVSIVASVFVSTAVSAAEYSFTPDGSNLETISINDLKDYYTNTLFTNLIKSSNGNKGTSITFSQGGSEVKGYAYCSGYKISGIEGKSKSEAEGYISSLKSAIANSVKDSYHKTVTYFTDVKYQISTDQSQNVTSMEVYMIYVLCATESAISNQYSTINSLISSCASLSNAEKVKKISQHMKSFSADSSSGSSITNLETEKRGSSNLFSTYVSLILDKMGIANKKISGTVSGTQQFWNVVQIEGSWYNLDTYQNSKTSSDRYTLKSASSMTGYSSDSSYFTEATKDYGGNSSGETEKTEYTTLSDGSIKLTGVNTKETDYTVPSSIDGKTVSSIAKNAFDSASSLAKLTIPSSVSSIEAGAFNGLNNLSSIVVESGNSSYSSSNGVLFSKDKTKLIAYPQNKSDSSYYIPVSVTSISDYAFYSANNLQTVVFTEKVSMISSSAFSSSNIKFDANGNKYVSDFAGEHGISCINASSKNVDHIIVTSTPSKTEYEKNEAIDLSGGKITVYYTDSSTEVIGIEKSMLSDYNMSKAGEQRVTVTYEGKTAYFYIKIVDPNASKENRLKSLIVKGGSLSPEFSPEILNYNVTVSNDTTKLNIVAKAQDSNAKVQIDAPVTTLEVEVPTTAHIRVIAENGDKLEYTVTVIRKSAAGLSKDSSLTGIEVKGGRFKTEFKKDLFDYTVIFVGDFSGFTKDDIIPTLSDKKASYKIDTPDEIIERTENDFLITVTAEDGSETEYVLRIFFYLNENEVPIDTTSSSYIRFFKVYKIVVIVLIVIFSLALIGNIFLFLDLKYDFLKRRKSDSTSIKLWKQ